jgi:diacylglycerol kinase family enzyme
MRISNDASFNDGVMELYILKGSHIAHTLGFVKDVWFGDLLKNERVECLKFGEIAIGSQAPVLLQLDGEPKYDNNCIKLGVLPGAIKVKVPAKP